MRYPLACLCVAAVLATGCSRQDARLEQHEKSFESLGATTAAVAEAWLAGDVSGTFAATALEETMRLVEQERAALASRPEMLQDARGARLSQDAEQLSRLVADMIADVRGADGSSARKRLAQIPIRPAPRT